MRESQSYANHTRYYPLFHFVVIPLLALNLIYHLVRLFQEPGVDRGVWVVVSFVFILMMLAGRLQALRAQDRVIRLEERLRYRDILRADLAEKAGQLPTGKIISMRFASDAELAHIVQQVVDGKLSTAKEIKSAIREWRADHLRV